MDMAYFTRVHYQVVMGADNIASVGAHSFLNIDEVLSSALFSYKYKHLLVSRTPLYALLYIITQVSKLKKIQSPFCDQLQNVIPTPIFTVKQHKNHYILPIFMYSTDQK